MKFWKFWNVCSIYKVAIVMYMTLCCVGVCFSIYFCMFLCLVHDKIKLFIVISLSNYHYCCSYSIGSCQQISLSVNTLRPRQHGRHFADDTFKRIFLNENVIISIKILLMFVIKDPINNIPALVQIMAWRRPGDKPLSKPMLVFVPTHICVTRPQWVNWLRQDELP